MNKRGKASFSVGASSILAIFVLLCLITFSALSVVSANADYKLTTKAANTVQNYWTANNHAQQVLADIDEMLSSIMQQYPTNDTAYYEAAVIIFATQKPGAVTVSLAEHGIDTYCFVIPAGFTQELYVEFVLEHSSAHFSRTAWLLRSTTELTEPEQGIDLWDGGEILFS